MTLIKRKSIETVMKVVVHRTADAVRDAITELLTPLMERVHTIVYDNGRMFADRKDMVKDLEIDNFFTHHYSSLEHGVNEISNGLFR